MPDFPVLDTDRAAIPDGEGHKTELADLGMIEPYVDEMDWWCRLPVRVTYGCLSGVVIELGPYTLVDRDVARLRDAIRAYDVANNGPTIRRVQ